MLTHGGLLESARITASVEEWKKDVQAAWTEWKEHEAKNR